MDAESLWRVIESGLRDMKTVDREKARKLFMRRLRHAESSPIYPTGLLVAESQIHPKQGGGPMPRIDSPLCECNDPRSSHDEDGSCRGCHCPLYTSAP